MESYSYSKVDCFMHCPQKYNLRYIQKLIPQRKSKPLALGSCIAAGIAEYRTSGQVEAARNAFFQTWLNEGKALALKRDDDPMRSVERGIEILNGYMEEYPDDPQVVVQAEIRFEEEIMPNILWRGRIDGVMDINGTLAVIEDKTASRLGDFYFKRLRKSYQVLWYMWVARHLGLFDITRPQAPKCLINVSYIHATNMRYERQLVPKVNRTLDDSFEDLKLWIKSIQYSVAENHFPQADSDECLKYGGCDYLPLRGTSSRIRESLIKTEYKVPEEKN